MDNEAAARLKFDRRMSKRGGWVEDEELAKELASAFGGHAPGKKASGGKAAPRVKAGKSRRHGGYGI